MSSSDLSTSCNQVNSTEQNWRKAWKRFKDFKQLTRPYLLQTNKNEGKKEALWNFKDFQELTRLYLLQTNLEIGQRKKKREEKIERKKNKTRWMDDFDQSY